MIHSTNTTAIETNSKSSRTKFILSGFGPFQGVAENPTTILMRKLREEFSTPCATDSSGMQSEIHPKENFKNHTSIHILETSAQSARQEIDHWFDSMKLFYGNDGSTLDHSNPENVVILHLGVNANGQKFYIETQAFNDATFRVPDEKGFTPMYECIVYSQPWGDVLTTSIDFQDVLQNCLQQRIHGPSYDHVLLSGDPGRFVCNYTYYYSLHKAKIWNETTCCQMQEKLHDAYREDQQPRLLVADTVHKIPKVHVLFVHVPPFHCISEEKQIQFLYHLMDSIQKSLGDK